MIESGCVTPSSGRATLALGTVKWLSKVRFYGCLADPPSSLLLLVESFSRSKRCVPVTGFENPARCNLEEGSFVAGHWTSILRNLLLGLSRLTKLGPPSE